MEDYFDNLFIIILIIHSMFNRFKVILIILSLILLFPLGYSAPGNHQSIGVGKLVIKVWPYDAFLYINNSTYRALNGTIELNLTQGNYTGIFYRYGFTPYDKSLQVVSNSTNFYSIKLTPINFGNYYFNLTQENFPYAFQYTLGSDGKWVENQGYSLLNPTNNNDGFRSASDLILMIPIYSSFNSTVEIYSNNESNNVFGVQFYGETPSFIAKWNYEFNNIAQGGIVAEIEPGINGLPLATTNINNIVAKEPSTDNGNYFFNISSTKSGNHYEIRIIINNITILNNYTVGLNEFPFFTVFGYSLNSSNNSYVFLKGFDINFSNINLSFQQGYIKPAQSMIIQGYSYDHWYDFNQIFGNFTVDTANGYYITVFNNETDFTLFVSYSEGFINLNQFYFPYIMKDRSNFWFNVTLEPGLPTIQSNSNSSYLSFPYNSEISDNIWNSLIEPYNIFLDSYDQWASLALSSDNYTLFYGNSWSGGFQPFRLGIINISNLKNTVLSYAQGGPAVFYDGNVIFPWYIGLIYVILLNENNVTSGFFFPSSNTVYNVLGMYAPYFLGDTLINNTFYTITGRYLDNSSKSGVFIFSLNISPTNGNQVINISKNGTAPPGLEIYTYPPFLANRFFYVSNGTINMMLKSYSNGRYYLYEYVIRNGSWINETGNLERLIGSNDFIENFQFLQQVGNLEILSVSGHIYAFNNKGLLWTINESNFQNYSFGAFTEYGNQIYAIGERNGSLDIMRIEINNGTAEPADFLNITYPGFNSIPGYPLYPTAYYLASWKNGFVYGIFEKGALGIGEEEILGRVKFNYTRLIMHIDNINGTKLSIGGKNIALNSSTLEFDVSPGIYPIMVYNPEYYFIAGNFNILPIYNNTLNFSLVRATSFLHVRIQPGNSTFNIDGASFHNVSNTTIPLPIGTWNFSISHKYYSTFLGNIKVHYGMNWLNVSLKHAIGNISIHSNVKNFEAIVDGDVFHAVGNYANITAPAGRQTVLIYHQYYNDDIIHNVIVTSNNTTYVSVNLTKAYGTLRINVMPDTTIFVDSYELNYFGNSTFIYLSPGYHWINATKPGYVYTSQKVLISSANTTVINLTMITAPAILKGSMNTKNATIIINNTEFIINGSNFIFGLKPGMVNIKIYSKWYEPYAKELSISNGINYLNVTLNKLTNVSIKIRIFGLMNNGQSRINYPYSGELTLIQGNFNVTMPISGASIEINGVPSGYVIIEVKGSIFYNSFLIFLKPVKSNNITLILVPFSISNKLEAIIYISTVSFTIIIAIAVDVMRRRKY